jgi:hypothetical protein
MSTVKPGVVGYLKTDDFVPVGSPYGVNQQPAAGSVVSDMSTFFSATPATDDTPAGNGTFLFQVPAATGSQTKVLARNFIIQGLSLLKLTAPAGGTDAVVVSKISADGLTTTTLFTFSIGAGTLGTLVFQGTSTTAIGAATFAAGETLKVAYTNSNNCACYVFVDVLGA